MKVSQVVCLVEITETVTKGPADGSEDRTVKRVTPVIEDDN